MDRFFSVIENPRGGEWHFYYLYALERVGRALDTEFIGSHEWYPLGARYLVDTQGKDGGWAEGGYEGPVWKAQAASYALLFLTRATPTLVSAPKAAPAPGGKGLLQATAGPGRPVRAYIILDASGSMLSLMDGRPKVDIARDVVAGIVQDLPEGSQVALRVYGHTKRAIEEGADEDTALEIPLEPLDRAAFQEKVKSLRARGKTPLALSLRQAAADLSGAGGGDPITVVLLTDGGEDTQPRQDPLAAAEEIGGIDNLKMHVVGFDIGRTEWARELAGITRNARGRYWPAPKAAELRKDLRALILGQPEGFLVLDRERRIVERGAFGQPKELPVGTYTLQTEVAGQVYEQPFSIGAGRTSPIAFDPSKMVKAPQGAAPPAATVPAPEAGAKAPAPGAEPAGDAGQKAPAARKFCSGCGTALKPEWKFCGKCGAKL
jgi:hypothetical protein